MSPLLFFILISASRIKLVGRVFDALTGEPLAGAGVVLLETKQGTMTDLDGYYEIEIPEKGEYTVKVSMIGYKPETKKIKITKTTELNFYLKEQTIEMPEQVVKAKKEVQIEKDVSATMMSIGKKSIEQDVDINIQEAIAKRLGAVARGTEIHIRGSRSNEVMLLLDGIPIKDPLSGSAFGIFIPKTAVSEVEAEIGGYNAEYGQASSGIIRYHIRDITERFSLFASYKTDNLGFKRFTNLDIASLSIQGPIRFLPLQGKVSYFLSLYGKIDDTYLPHADSLYSSVVERTFPREENTFSITGKVAWQTKNGNKLSYLFTKSLEVNQGYYYHRSDYPFAYGFPYRYINILQNYLTFTRDANTEALSYHHVFNLKNFFDLKLARFFTNLHADVNGKLWNEYVELQDTYPQDNFYDLGDAPYFHDHYVETYTFKFDYTKIFSKIIQGKTGILLQRNELQWVDIDYPWYSTASGLGLNHDIYRARSITGGAYIQSSIHFAGMIANVGMRLDFWEPGKYVDEGVKRALLRNDLPFQIRKEYESYLHDNFTIRGRIFKAHISPRLGFSYPITDVDKFYLSYGHFTQLPDLKYVYSKLGTRASSSYELVGNPNLNQIVSVSYEMGVSHLLNDYEKLNLTAYYKDIFNYPTARKIQGIPPNPDYWMYFNSDYSRSVGVEIRFRRALKHHISSELTLSLSQDKGRSSSPEDAYWLGGEESLKEWYLRWDRPFKFYGDINFVYGKGEYFSVLGNKVLSDFSLSLQVSAKSGRRYTPMDTLGNKGEINSRIGPMWHRVDVVFTKTFRIKRTRLKFRAQVRNLFNHRNVYYVNPVTGRAYEPGDPLPPRKTEKDMLNPARYLQGRTIYLGLEVML